MGSQPSYWKVLTRRKMLLVDGTESDTKLNRVLGLFDLTALGVGSTLGAGVYVLAGQIARDQAGPSVMISFAIAALASLLAGICYAEFGARVPKAGSAYIYSYVCIGEFAAFVIGWNLMLEYIIGTASVCRGISLYLDSLVNDTLKTTFTRVAPMNVSFLGSYFDFFAFGLVIFFGIILAFGVETSAILNNFCTCLNIFVLLFVIVAGAIKANFENWTVDITNIDKDQYPNAGTGGYFPFGFAGTLKGAATCFFGFVGFDCIATTGEEVRNPRRNIPRSILLSLFIIFLCYFGVSTVLTLMVPYYAQDPNAPLPYAFKMVGWTFAMWVVAIGGLIGLLASLFGALFPLPRIMYSMAEDRLLFHFLGKISPRFQVPVVGSIFAAIFTALMAGLFDLQQLVNLLSIGTLLAYSVVAISITILRYMDNSEDSDRENGNQPLSESTLLTTPGSRITLKHVLLQLCNFKRLDTPNTLSTRIVGCYIAMFSLLSLAIGVVIKESYDALITNQLWVLVLLPILVILAFLTLLAICFQPREAVTGLFRVPFVPFVPGVSIFINVYLMLQLDVMTWIRFGIWMAIGLPIFFACWCIYDFRNPEKRNPNRVEFLRALKKSMYQGDENRNGDLTKDTNENDSIKPTKTPNGTAASMKNTHSVKSLDEIMNLSDVSDDLIEMRHPNGKIFYIEDEKSNTSKSSLGKDDSAKAATSLPEDEDIAIAMLDDVLSAADAGSPFSRGGLNYSRKFSVDSEMLPSVIETTTVATVHSSSNSSDELEVVPEIEGQQSRRSSDTSTFGSKDIYAETVKLAAEIVDEVLSSTELLNALEGKKMQKAKNNEETIEDPQTPPAEATHSTNEHPTLRMHKRTPSKDSLLSDNSIDDPMHSEKFKHKLNKILMQQPAPVATQKISNIARDALPTRPQLKQSKSETDIRPLVLKAIEGTGLKLDDDDASNETQAPIKDTNGIPKPPKFDPILYKTINSLGTTKDRPSLQRIMNKVEAPEAVVEKPTIDSESDTQPAMPFKQKLEAVLKSGPSHRSQQRPDALTRKRPKSEIPLPVSENSVITNGKDESLPKEKIAIASEISVMANGINQLKRMSESNITLTTDPTVLIENAKNSLKHVENGHLL